MFLDWHSNSICRVRYKRTLLLTAQCSLNQAASASLVSVFISFTAA